MSEPEFPFERDPVIEAYKKDIDRGLIRENLKLTFDERAAQLSQLQKAAEEFMRAGREAAKGQ